MIRRASLLALVCAGAPACAPPQSSVAPRPLPEAAPVHVARDNPFAGARFYVDPGFVAKVEATAASTPARADQIRRVEAFPTAVWLDSIASVASVSRHLDAALALQKSSGQPVVTLFVIYDLPERDCSAKASAGELTASNRGEERYKTEFIAPIAAQFRAHDAQRIAVVVEPDSLANVATNLSVGRCAAAEGIYRRSLAAAIRALALPNVSLYLDAAHAGWLGWGSNRRKIARIFRDVLDAAGGVDLVRGFATNVSNYDSLHDGDIARLEPSDPCHDEIGYVEKLTESLAELGIAGKGFVIDTARNGRAGIRTKSASWCNIKGAGLGARPQASPAPGIDAYWWVKPPGDSDGGSDPNGPGFDDACGPAAADSAQGAPPAGQWFVPYFLQLVENADPPV
ncbi:MAG TPA: glycoside hydrolase family 6 protein [Polyangiaceae bacterium]|nr:glycoside hydrolase family 6 protein [Polyangiaceae bacterium]